MFKRLIKDGGQKSNQASKQMSEMIIAQLYQLIYHIEGNLDNELIKQGSFVIKMMSFSPKETFNKVVPMF